MNFENAKCQVLSVIYIYIDFNIKISDPKFNCKLPCILSNLKLYSLLFTN